MTYRERREARADRLRGWAEKREAKADAGFARSSEMAAQIPFGQPILMGHYSQGRDTRYRERIVNTGQRALEDSRKAESMNSRADNIESALAGAIYSDDPDAIEALTARIAKLEADRAQDKATNAAFRKTHAAELKAMTSAYQRNHAMPFPSYHFANLSGNISKQRQRLAQLKAKAANAPSATFFADFPELPF